jgi:hypothetical protein
MGIKNLKEQNKNLNINLIDIISEFDETKTKKLTPFLVKMFKKDNKTFNRIKDIYKEVLMDFLGNENIRVLKSFAEHLENNRIDDTDINSYSDWSNIIAETNKAEIKLLDKEISKKIEVIHEDDKWLILKPLSFKASLAYGSNTKWCTAMKSEPSYFYRYSKNGILIYVIDKINGIKYGFNSSPEEFSVWNQKDVRIDSLETTIPTELLLKIREFSDLSVHVCNFNKFSEEEVEDFLRLDRGKPISVLHEELMVNEEQMMVEEIDYPEAQEEVMVARTAYYNEPVANDYIAVLNYLSVEERGEGIDVNHNIEYSDERGR